MKEIQFLLTGGTIDSEYDPTTDTVVPFPRSGIKPYLSKFIQPNFEIHEKVITLADSRDIDDNIREVIVKAIKESKHDNIIIPHGTYTMSETAVYIANEFAADKTSLAKKVILMGSFYPLVGFAQSDAPYNIGFAIGCIEYLKPGVYVAMNSQIFDAHNVSKNIIKAKFTSKE